MNIKKIHFTKTMLAEMLGVAVVGKQDMLIPLTALFKSDQAALKKLGFTPDATEANLVVAAGDVTKVLEAVSASTLRDRHTEAELTYLAALNDTPDEEDEDEEDEEDDALEEGEEPEPAVAPVAEPAPATAPVRVSVPATPTITIPAYQAPPVVQPASVALSAPDGYQTLYLEERRANQAMVERFRTTSLTRELDAATARGVNAAVINFARPLLTELAKRLETATILELSDTAGGTATPLDTFEAVLHLLTLVQGKVPTERKGDEGKQRKLSNDTPPQVEVVAETDEAFKATVGRLINTAARSL